MRAINIQSIGLISTYNNHAKKVIPSFYRLRAWSSENLKDLFINQCQDLNVESWSELESAPFKPLASKSSGLQRGRGGSGWSGWEGVSDCTRMCTNSSPNSQHSSRSSSCCPTELHLHVGRTWEMEGSLIITQLSGFQISFWQQKPLS